MKKSRVRAGVYTLCLMAILVLVLAMPVQAEDTRQTVKVGYFAMDGYNEIDENGLYSGYDYDFFQMLSRYTSLDFEFVGYDKSWQEMQEMLASGEIDVLTSMHATDERRMIYDFSYDIGSSYTMLTVRSGNNAFEKDSVVGYDGLRIGMLSESSQNDVFAAYAKENGFTYSAVYYDNVADLSLALQEGKVDAAVTSSLRKLHGERVVEKIQTSKFYAAVSKGNEELLEEINQGITQMDLYEGDWRNTLYYKYYGYQEESDTDIEYSEREQEILARYTQGEETLKVCFDPTAEPYSFVEKGKMVGILPDVVGELLDKLGINYEFTVTDSYEEYLQVYQKGEADVFPEVIGNASQEEQEAYLFTDSYFSIKMGVLTRRSGSAVGSVIAVLNDRPVYDTIDFQDAEVKGYDTLDELVAALEKGEVDAAYLMNYTAQMYVNRESIGELTYISREKLYYDICFAVNKAIPHEICSILNKNVSALAEKDYYSLSMEYIKNDLKDLTMTEYLQTHPNLAVLLFAFNLLLAVVVMALIFTNVQKNREKRMNIEREAEREKQQQRLRKALQEAEAANQAKSIFLSNMSHDIRTPMNAIVGFAALAKTHLEDKERAIGYMEKISTASDHLLALINDVLDMSRIESGKMSLEETPCDLSELIRDISSIILVNLQEKQLEFTIDKSGMKNEGVVCDTLHLNQILLNLLGNAIKFTPAGGSIALCIVEKPGNRADESLYEFHVKDTGIGIGEKFLKHVFEPFERERNSTVSGIQGTGLGLPITRKLVEMMQGTITVESQQGKGSEFVVTIPLKTVDIKAIKKEKQQSGLPERDLKGLRVLVVEDNALNREIATSLLEEAGLIPEAVESGELAIEQLLEKGAGYYQLVLMDIQMPGIDGYATTRAIRAFANQKLAHIPIIAMTANAFKEDKQKAKEAGMNGHIAKPVAVDSLMSTITQVMGQEEEN